MKLSDKLIELRKEQGWSQEEFAEKLEVSRQAVSRWENETALPDAQNILRISRLFGVSADYLLNDDYEKEQSTLTIEESAESDASMPTKKARRLRTIGLSILMTVAGVALGTVIGAYFLTAQTSHVHDGWECVKKNVIASTCTTQGSYDEVVYCTTCHEELSRASVTMETLAHRLSGSMKEDEVAPTCTKEGTYSEVVYCVVCEQVVLTTHRNTAKTAHQYQNGLCVACGEYKPSDGLLFMSNGNGTCTVGLGDCTDEIVIIPTHSPTGETVVKVKAYAFAGNSRIKRVQIPETVTVIGEGAFQDCEALEYVNLPNGISMIDSFTFDGCINLKEITLPSGVTYIGREAFADCRACERIVIPASVYKIGYYAFRSFSGGTGTVIFEVYDTWEMYDSSGKWVKVLDFREERFDAVSYLTIRFCDYTWIRK
jgi:transcriptional regulator with XRE-family HTH domain